MSTDVLMIDKAKFAAIMDAKIAEHKALAEADKSAFGTRVLFNGAIAAAMSEVGKAIIQSSIVEKWD